MDHYEDFMKECISLAAIALENGNPPVGVVVVLDGQVIGKGIESGRTSGDITNHAEIVAIRDAVSHGNANKLPQCALVTTHEPCIMCSYVIRHHKIPLVVTGAAVQYIGGHSSRFNILDTHEIPTWGHPPRVIENVLLDECLALTEQYKKRRKSVPHQ